ncbi:MFS transporter, partial [Lactobacillus delbrueckii subsp. bulgaricus]|nr:MFS transporter [Lactobacillus delbrueckii subsp. bulgaricus]
ILTAWAAAGMVGPLLLSFTHEVLKSYYVTLAAFIILAGLGLCVSFLIKREFAKLTDLADELD